MNIYIIVNHSAGNKLINMEDNSILTLDLFIEKLKSLIDYYNCGDFTMKFKDGKYLENFTCDNFYIDTKVKDFIINTEK